MNINQLTAAALVFEKNRGIKQTSYNLELITGCGYTDLGSDELKDQIFNVFESDKIIDAELRSTAYWALGKKVDMDLIPFFVQRLKIELTEHIQAAYQIMIALDCLGESVFGKDRNGKYTFNEDELNHRDGLIYLDSK